MYIAVFLCLIVSHGSPPWSTLRGSIFATQQICLFCPHLALKNPHSQTQSLRLDRCAAASHHSVQTLLEIIQSQNRHQDKIFLSSPPTVIGSVSRPRPLGYLLTPHKSLSTTSCQSFRMELPIAPRSCADSYVATRSRLRCLIFYHLQSTCTAILPASSYNSGDYSRPSSVLTAPSQQTPCILPRICSIIHCTIFIFAFAMDYALPWISDSCSYQAFFVSEIVSICTCSLRFRTTDLCSLLLLYRALLR